MRGIHRRPVNSPHKRPVTRKMVPFDDVIMLNFNSCTIEVWEWINNFTPHFIMDVINYLLYLCTIDQKKYIGLFHISYISKCKSGVWHQYYGPIPCYWVMGYFISIFSTGVGLLSQFLSIPLFSFFFRMIKIPVVCMISCSYLAGVTAAGLWWHLSNMNVIQRI